MISLIILIGLMISSNCNVVLSIILGLIYKNNKNCFYSYIMNSNL